MLFIESTTNPLTANDLPQQLERVLARIEPLHAQQTAMSPELSYGRHAGPAPITARAAAVMLLLFQRDGRWHVPLTERPAALMRHGGQISLPGGRLDPGETSCEAARRELAEELGISRGIEPVGRLADCYVFASDFVVTPWVTVAHEEPHWQPNSQEVERVVELPLDLLLQDDAVEQLTIQRGPLVFRAPCYRVGESRVWGATSVILWELAEVLRKIMSAQHN